MKIRVNAVVVYILAVWFVLSLVTNIIGPLMPSIISDFHLSLTLAGLLPFSFFVAYGVISIPAGLMFEAWGAKATLLVAFALNLAGALTFAFFPVYRVAIGSLFVLGLAMAMLQVVINPLMRTAGGEEHFAFFSVLGQLVFGLASYVGPMIFTAIGRSQINLGVLTGIAPHGPTWATLYWLFAAIFALTLLVTLLTRLPTVALNSDERAGAWSTYVTLLRQRQVWAFFLGIAAYVGTEQSLANWMSQFLATYHGVSPTLVGAQEVGLFWGLMSVGCLVGLGLLKLLDARQVLVGACAAAIVVLAIALLGGRQAALIAFPTLGFCLSVMFSIVFSLALNSVAENQGALSGILCSGILGGAVVPLLVGALGEHIGLRLGLCAVFVTLAYLLTIGLWAKPLVANQTVDLRALLSDLRTKISA